VLYLDGQEPRTIAAVVGAILALLVALALIAPRLRVSMERDGTPPGHGTPTEMGGSRAEPAHPVPDTTAPAKPGRRAKRGRRRH